MAGWALIVVGLAAFVTSYLMLISLAYFEALPIVFIGVIIFRGGIHLLKVAVAARVVMESAEKKPRE
jgi:ABC-type uncharacterized transport system permease subunit